MSSGQSDSLKTYELLERLGAALRGEARRIGSEHGLQPVQLDALRYLTACNRVSNTPAAVSEFLGLTKGTVSQSLKALEAKGLLGKQLDADDKRVVHLIPTAQGRALIEVLFPPSLMVEATEGADSGDLRRELENLLRGFQRVRGLRSFGICKACRHNRELAANEFQCGLTGFPLKPFELDQVCREHEPVGDIN